MKLRVNPDQIIPSLSKRETLMNNPHPEFVQEILFYLELIKMNFHNPIMNLEML